MHLYASKQRIDSATGLVLLPEAESSAGGDDHEDDHAVGQVAQQHRQHRRDDQDEDDRIRELGQQKAYAAASNGSGYDVGAVGGQPAGGFGRRQPCRRVLHVGCRRCLPKVTHLHESLDRSAEQSTQAGACRGVDGGDAGGVDARAGADR